MWPSHPAPPEVDSREIAVGGILGRRVQDRVRGTILKISVCFLAVACQPAGSTDLAVGGPGLSIQPSPSPYTRVTAGPVQALVPDGWDAMPLDPSAGYRGGFQASPELDGWARMDGSTAGMAATWVDATRVGVPSDFYYLAATGPLLTRLTRSEHCRAGARRVFLDREPTLVGVGGPSPGDYVARGTGTCSVGEELTRWAYFVAAPGFGPVREVGIPSSGLYVVVAVLEDSNRARLTLRRLVGRATFGSSSVVDLLTVARAARPA